VKRALLATIVLVAAALGADASDDGSGELLARLERTACYGYCPSYTAEITRSG